MKLNLSQIVIAVLAAFLIFFTTKGCIEAKRYEKKIAKLEKDCAAQQTDTVTKVVKEAVNIPVYVPQPYNVYIEKPVSVPHEIYLYDTVFIVNDYQSKAVYRDSFQTKFGKYYIQDTLQFNRIAGRRIQGSETVTEKTIVKTITQPKKNQVWLGLGGMYQDKTIFPTASLMFAHKRGIAYEATVGYQGGFIYGAGVKYKISFK